MVSEGKSFLYATYEQLEIPFPESTVEIGGQVMTESQFNAARFPLLNPPPDDNLALPDWVMVPSKTQGDFGKAVSKVYREAEDLLLKKHKDYGPKNISGAPGGALNGLLVRMTDKMARLEHLHYNKQDPENESLRETFMDLANYGLIAVLVLDGEWPQ